MINIKTPKEIEVMKTGGKILSQVMWELIDFVKPGVSEIEIDKLAEKLIRQKDGESGFKKVKGYGYTVCLSTNDVVVHGIPTNYKLTTGDVIGIDCGVFYQGFHTDMSETVIVGKPKDKQKEQFLNVGKLALIEAIRQAKVGNRVGHISKTIQDIVRKNGYSVVESLVGHGVGRNLHEEPEVPGFLIDPIEQTPLLTEGMVIAIEVIYNMGKPDLKLDKDGWTLKTKDGSLGGLFEKTVAITKNGPLILTR